MAESSRAKVKELLVRHSELEQSETKAQAALVTILSLTQITELKLLLDIGRQGHRFYDFVLTLLVACISLEIFVGVIIIYIGNLHYYQSPSALDGCGRRSTSVTGCCRAFYRCFDCCRRSCRLPTKRSGTYESVGADTASTTVPPAVQTPSLRSPAGASDEGGGALAAVRGRRADWSALEMPGQGVESAYELERADRYTEASRIKVADAEVRIVRASNYVRVVEEALRKTPGGNVELEEELGRARDELASATRQREEGEAEQRLADALLQRSFGVREHAEDQLERLTFRKVSLWQHTATYLLYFVMLMNVFVTTFGISGGVHGSVFGGVSPSSTQPSPTPPPTLPPPADTTFLPIPVTISQTSTTTIEAVLANITSS